MSSYRAINNKYLVYLICVRDVRATDSSLSGVASRAMQSFATICHSALKIHFGMWNLDILYRYICVCITGWKDKCLGPAVMPAKLDREPRAPPGNIWRCKWSVYMYITGWNDRCLQPAEIYTYNHHNHLNRHIYNHRVEWQMSTTVWNACEVRPRAPHHLVIYGDVSDLAFHPCDNGGKSWLSVSGLTPQALQPIAGFCHSAMYLQLIVSLFHSTFVMQLWNDGYWQSAAWHCMVHVRIQ